MGDLFEDDDDIMDAVDCLDKIDVEPELIKTSSLKDARIRLEKKLDEKRLREQLRDELDDLIIDD